MNRNSVVRTWTVLGIGLIGATATFPLASAALAGQSTADVSTAAEAWYYTPGTAVCTAPIGCPPTPTEAFAYPPGNLRVGVAVGQPSAHAYVDLDRSAIPSSAAVVSATLTLPISQAQQSGNVQPETARLLACLAKDPIEDGVEGGVTEAPAYDCEVAQSPAEFREDDSAFTIDLGPILAAWSSGEPAHGIALVPDAEQEPGGSWQVSFVGRRADEEPKITATIGFETTTDSANQTQPLPQSSEDFPMSVPAPADLDPPAPAAAMDEADAAPQAAPAPDGDQAKRPEVADSPQPAASGLINIPWFDHMGVVYLPLILLAGIIATGRTLTLPLRADQLTRST